MKYATRVGRQMTVRELLIEALRAAPGELRPILYYLVNAYNYDEQTLRGIIREVRPEEEEPMMSQFAQEIKKKALLEGIQQGRQEGHLEGRQEGRLEGLLEGEAKGETKGEAKLLMRQLSRRFQPLPNEVTDRIQKADPNTIEIWADRILDAKSLDEVFLE
uniref:DUF4351 domain-containing protein n=1 Tax=Candidatus Kentrum sp. LPFa TaxID=2126335 RepID=A0A450X2Y3_9GAMM|nr:MAG: protein of unknown function (DUF4351) [Candidatus Kentron sp. LPFa]